MIHGELAAIEVAREHLAMNAQVGIFRGIGCDAVEVAIVVAEDDVDGMRIAAADLVGDERRAEIAAAEHRAGIVSHGVERGREFPYVVVDVGENGDSHGGPIGCLQPVRTRLFRAAVRPLSPQSGKTRPCRRSEFQ
jgi:hypothetical protein